MRYSRTVLGTMCPLLLLIFGAVQSSLHGAEPESKKYAEERKSLEARLKAAAANERRARDEEHLAAQKALQEKKRAFEEAHRVAKKAQAEAAIDDVAGSDDVSGSVAPNLGAPGAVAGGLKQDMRLQACDERVNAILMHWQLGGAELTPGGLAGDLLAPIITDLVTSVRSELQDAVRQAIRDKFKLPEPPKKEEPPKPSDLAQLKADVQKLQGQFEADAFSKTITTALIKALDDTTVKAKIKKAATE